MARHFYAVEYRIELDDEGEPTVPIGSDGLPSRTEHRIIRRFDSAAERDRWVKYDASASHGVRARYALMSDDLLVRAWKRENSTA